MTSHIHRELTAELLWFWSEGSPPSPVRPFGTAQEDA